MVKNGSFRDLIVENILPWKQRLPVMCPKANLTPVQEYEATLSLEVYTAARNTESLKELKWGEYLAFRYWIVWASLLTVELTSIKEFGNMLARLVPCANVTIPKTISYAPSVMLFVKRTPVLSRTFTANSDSSSPNIRRTTSNSISIAKKRPWEDAKQVNACKTVIRT